MTAPEYANSVVLLDCGHPHACLMLDEEGDLYCGWCYDVEYANATANMLRLQLDEVPKRASEN